MYIVIFGFSCLFLFFCLFCFVLFFFVLFCFVFCFVLPFKAPGLRLPPQVWLAFCMASISIYCHNNNNNKKKKKKKRRKKKNNIGSNNGNNYKSYHCGITASIEYNVANYVYLYRRRNSSGQQI